MEGAREIAGVIAAGRVAIGAALTVVPRTAARPWLGSESRRPSTALFARGLGARDIGIGVGLLRALAAGQPPTLWLLAGVAADAADGVATWSERRRLPPVRTRLVAASALVSAGTGLWLARELT